MNRIRTNWKKIPLNRRLYVVVGIMATLIACELVILTLSMSKVSSVRAFVGGEALWSKAQKNALLELKRFERTHNEKSYEAFLNYLTVPEGDHRAREELMKAHPDMSVVRSGFLQGNIHRDDIDQMVSLLVHFHWISYVAQAIDDWAT